MTPPDARDHGAERDQELDLGALLRPIEPPPGGAARARRTARRRWLVHRVAAGGAALVAVASAGVAFSRSDERRPGPVTNVATTGAERLLVVTWLGGRSVAETLDLATGESAPTAYRGDAHVVLPRRGALVVRPGDEQEPDAVRAMRPPYRGRGRKLGDAQRVVPSVHEDRVWLVTEQVSGDGGGPQATVRMSEVDVDGRVTSPPVDIPCCRALFADTPTGLFFSWGPYVELWERSPLRLVRTVDAGTPVFSVAGHWVMAATNEGCETDAGTVEIVDLRSGERRRLGEACTAMPAAFSPDARWAVVRTPTDGAATSLVLFDTGGGAPVAVPRSNSADWVHAWTSDGRIYFVAIDSKLVLSFDPQTSEVEEVHRVDRGIVRGLIPLPPAQNGQKGQTASE